MASPEMGKIGGRDTSVKTLRQAEDHSFTGLETSNQTQVTQACTNSITHKHKHTSDCETQGNVRGVRKGKFSVSVIQHM